MDLSAYSLEDIVLTAIRAEVEAQKMYRSLAGRVKNMMMKDRLEFLANEEQKHADFFRAYYEKQFPGKEMVVPQKTVVPLPDITVDVERAPISDVLEQAMEAEAAAEDFYRSMAEMFPPDEEEDTDPYALTSGRIRKMLLYIASMEKGHHDLLAVERDKMLEFESQDVWWDMIHVGP